KRIGMMMNEFPNSAFLPKDVRHSQNHRSRLVLSDHQRLATLDRHGVSQIIADSGGNVFDPDLGSAFFEAGGGPIIPGVNFGPSLSQAAPAAHDCDVVAMRGVLFPESRIAVDEAIGSGFELR